MADPNLERALIDDVIHGDITPEGALQILGFVAGKRWILTPEDARKTSPGDTITCSLGVYRVTAVDASTGAITIEQIR